MTKIEPVNNEFFSAFNEEACDLCGECFYKCPVMEFTIEEAIEEMKRLLSGEKTNVLICF